VAHDRRRGRLSIGAGDAENPQAARWIAVSGCGCECRSATSFPDDQRWQRGSRGIFDDRSDCSPFSRTIQKIMAVAIPAPNRDEQIAWQDFPAVVRDPRRLIWKIIARRYEQTSIGERGFYILDGHAHSTCRLT